MQFARNYIETEAKISKDEEERYKAELDALKEDHSTLQALVSASQQTKDR